LILLTLLVSIFLFKRPIEQPVPLPQSTTSSKTQFNGEVALELIRQQVAFGPRFVGSPGHAKEVEWLQKTMKQYSNEIIVQQGNGATNIIGRFNSENPRRVLLVTHYDSRQFASNDKEFPKEPVIGANNSASGVAVLLEVAKQLDNETMKQLTVGVDVVLFDGEEWDVDHPTGAQWQPLGSTHFVQHLKDFYPKELPVVAIDLDLVCSKSMKLYKEESSLERARSFMERFWMIARERFLEQFVDDVKWNILDDHTLLNAAGIPAFLLIDYDYPWIHTTQDTIDKCSAKSLEAVGDSLVRFLRTLR